MDTTLCRVCLGKTGTVSVFDAQDGLQLSAKIMRCVSVTIVQNDGLPNTICDGCATELAVTYEFIQKCEATDKALRYLNFKEDFVDPEAETKLEIDIKETEDIQFELDPDFDSDSATIKEEYLNETQPLQVEYENAKNHEIQDRKENHIKKLCNKKRSVCVKRAKAGPLQCVICGQITTCRSAMETHMRKHTGENPFGCHMCHKHFRSKGSLSRHIQTRHSHRERKFTCELCGSSFYRKHDIIIHMRVHTDERPHSCPFCSKSFRQITSLIRHKRMHTGEKPFGCPICGKKFSDKNLVKKHQSVHSNEKKYTCHLCSKSMKTRNALNAHMSLHTNEKQIICSFCGAAFNMKGNLQSHIRRVHSEKSGQCTICLKTFSDLEVHMRKHTGERPYLCKMCNQSYTTQRSLSHHIAFKHVNVMKFKCSIGECTRTFPTAMMLEFHLLKQHTNNTPYVCQHCSRGFFRNSDLTRHLRGSHMDHQTNLK